MNNISSFSSPTAEPCANIPEMILKFQILLPLGACLSYVSYFIIFILYYGLGGNLKRHPTSLSIYKCYFELVYVSQYFWLPFVHTSFFWASDDDGSNGYCVVKPNVAILCFLTQYSLLGGELWFAVISRDIKLTITNPFTSYIQQSRRYTAFAIIGAFIPAFILMFLKNINNQPVYGLSWDPMIWIQDRIEDNQVKGQINYNKIGLFYVWMAIIYSYSLYVLLFATRRISKGLESTLQARLATVNRARAFTIGYSLYWTTIFALQFLDFSGVLGNFYHEKEVRTISSFVLAARGVWSLVIFIAANWTDLMLELKKRKEEPDRSESIFAASVRGSKISRLSDVQSLASDALDFNPHLNGLLRREILYYTTQGIKIAALEQQRDENGQLRSMGAWSAPLRPKGGSLFSRSSNNDEKSTFSFSFKEFNRNVVRSSQQDVQERASDDPAEDSNSDQASSPGLIPRSMLMSFEGSRSLIAQRHKSNSNARRTSNLARVEEPLRSSLTSNEIEPFAGSGGLANVAESPTETHLTVATSSEENVVPLTENNLSTLEKQREMEEAEERALSEIFAEEMQRSTMQSDFRLTDIELEQATWQRVSTAAGKDPNAASSPAAEAQRSGGGDNEETLMHRWVRAAESAKRALDKVAAPSHDFTFRDFCPKTFRYIRKLSNIREDDYIQAFEQTTREKFSEGRSGAFLYFSANEKYIVKTTTKEEMTKLIGMLPGYIEHIKNHPLSFITRFTGAHAIVMYDITLYFIVMKNVMPNKMPLSERYDLKGSWVNRNGNFWQLTRTERLQQDMFKQVKSAALLKDNDLQHRINLPPEIMIPISLEIKEDIKFLRAMNVMDYSLLIGVHKRKYEVIDKQQPAGAGGSIRASMMSLTSTTGAGSQAAANPLRKDADGGMHAGVVEGPYSYYFGLVDVLQEWDTKKKLESWFKINMLQLDAEGISAIAPQPYAARFWKRVMVDVFDHVDGPFEDVADIPGTGSQHSVSGGVSLSPVTGPLSLETDPDPRSITSGASEGARVVASSPHTRDRRFSVVPIDVSRESWIMDVIRNPGEAPEDPAQLRDPGEEEDEEVKESAGDGNA